VYKAYPNLFDDSIGASFSSSKDDKDYEAYDYYITSSGNNPPELSEPKVLPENALKSYNGNFEYSAVYEDKDGRVSI
jgi:hypothetical protein